MPTNLKRRGQALPGRAAAIALGRKPPPADEVIDVDPALDGSRVTTLFGWPYPVQFRNPGNTEVWHRWQDPGTLCWDIRQELSWQLEHMHPMSLVAQQATEKVAANCHAHLVRGACQTWHGSNHRAWHFAQSPERAGARLLGAVLELDVADSCHTRFVQCPSAARTVYVKELTGHQWPQEMMAFLLSANQLCWAARRNQLQRGRHRRVPDTL